MTPLGWQRGGRICDCLRTHDAIDIIHLVVRHTVCLPNDNDGIVCERRRRLDNAGIPRVTVGINVVGRAFTVLVGVVNGDDCRAFVCGFGLLYRRTFAAAVIATHPLQAAVFVRSTGSGMLRCFSVAISDIVDVLGDADICVVVAVAFAYICFVLILKHSYSRRQPCNSGGV